MNVRESGLGIKLVEKTGTSVKGLLQRSDPLKKDRRCKEGDCIVCVTGGRGNCRTSGVTYELKCKLCDSVYVGETGRSAYVRGKEHLAAMDSDLDSSVLSRHFRERHEGLLTDFTMSVTGVYAGDAMIRQIAESVKINKKEQAKMINNKTEWNYVNVPRARVA